MKHALEIHPDANDEANDAIRYYEKCEPGLGERFRHGVQEELSRILQYPLLSRQRRGGFRRYNLPDFPYYIATILRGDRIIVVAIAHSSRHPDYWKSRLK